MTLRLAFMGTPHFAVPVLEALAASPHQVVAVYTQPPRPSGRGYKVQKSPVQDCAEARGIEARHPVSLKSPEAQAEFAALDLDCAIVAAYGLILPRAILAAPKQGCLNIHGSLLPRWRGAAPIQRAILAGDNETGITIMQMEAGLDTGAMLLKDSVPIGPQTTAMTLHDALAAMGARLILPALEGFIAGTIAPEKQDDSQATYAAKLTREEGKLDWTQPALLLDRQIRALVPWPGTWFELRGEIIKVGAAKIVAANGPPGQVLDGDMTIACGENALRLTKIQRPGRGWVSGKEFVQASGLEPGDALR